MAGAASLPAGPVPSFLGRIGRMVLAPWREWETVAGEGTTARDLYVGYVAPLAAIGAVASLVASTVVGVDVGATRVRAGIPAGVAAALLRYALAFAAVALLARIAASLAPRFGGQADRVVALRVVAYSLIPAWLAAALTAAPALHTIAGVLALYSAFVLFVGLRTVMRCPEGWAIFLAAILSALAWVFGALATPVASFTAGLAAIGSPAPGARDRTYAAGAATSLLATMALQSDPADRRRVLDAVGSVAGLGAGFVRDIVGDGNADGDDLLDRVAAEAATVAAGGRKFELVRPESLIPLLPPTVAGLPRVSATALIDAPVFTLKGSIARARYERGSAHVELELGDMGELWGVVRLIARFDPLFEKTSGSVRERSGRIDGRYFQEKFDERDGSGKFGRLLDDRFAVAARGSGVTLAALHQAVDAVDAAGVVALGRAR